MKLNFGHKLFIAAAAFVAFIFFLTGNMLSQKIDLVAPDYYQQGLEHQQKIDEKTLHNRNIYQYFSRNNIFEAIPDTALPSGIPVKLKFYRPSDAALDFETSASTLQNGVVRLSDTRLTSGYWEVNLQWEENGHWSYSKAKLLWP